MLFTNSSDVICLKDSNLKEDTGTNIKHNTLDNIIKASPLHFIKIRIINA